MSIKNFFHHLFNPHCELCEEYNKKLYECDSCRVLREQLDYERRQNQMLIDSILNKPSDNPMTSTDITFEPINTGKFASFKEKRRQLEEQDKVQAEKLAKLKEDESAASDIVSEIRELEVAIGVNND